MALFCCQSRCHKSWGLFALCIASFVFSMGLAMGTNNDDPIKNMKEEPKLIPYVLGHSANRIDGATEKLDQYKGNVILVVNVASECGLTPQYEALEALYREKKDEGFVILAFPANNFGSQEPGTNEEIAQFCSAKFNVSFPMFEKVSVKGKYMNSLFAHLAALSAVPSWNFTKYLVGRDGEFVERFDPRTTPEDEAFVAKIDELLKADAPETTDAHSE